MPLLVFYLDNVMLTIYREPIHVNNKVCVLLSPYVCLAWKQYLSIIIANPCIRNCDNMNRNIWKLVSHKYSHPLLQPIYTQLYKPFLACWKAKEVDQKKKKTKQRREKMVFNISFKDHVIRMVGGHHYWRIFVRKDFCFKG